MGLLPFLPCDPEAWRRTRCPLWVCLVSSGTPCRPEALGRHGHDFPEDVSLAATQMVTREP